MPEVLKKITFPAAPKVSFIRGGSTVYQITSGETGPLYCGLYSLLNSLVIYTS